MISLEYTHETPTSPLEMFEYFLVVEKMKLWMEDLVSVEYTSDTEASIGSTFIQHLIRDGEAETYHGTILQIAKPNLLKVKLEDSRMVITATNQFTQNGDLTSWHYTTEFEFLGYFGKVTEKLAYPIVKRKVDRQVELIKELIG